MSSLPRLPDGWEERLRGRLARFGVADPEAMAAGLAAELAPLLAERERRLTEALRWYADPGAYEIQEGPERHYRDLSGAYRRMDEDTPINCDGGEIARQVLAAVSSDTGGAETPARRACENCRGDGRWRFDNGAADWSKRCPLCDGTGVERGGEGA